MLQVVKTKEFLVWGKTSKDANSTAERKELRKTNNIILIYYLALKLGEEGHSNATHDRAK